MTCRETTPVLSAYLDRTLDADTHAHVGTHLDACESCRALLADLHHIRSAARSLGPITPPDHIWLEIAGRIRLEQGAPLPLTRPVRTRTTTTTPPSQGRRRPPSADLILRLAGRSTA